MPRLLIGGIAATAILAAATAGYRLGAGTWPGGLAPHPDQAGSAIAAPQPKATARQVLYWKHPDDAADFSPHPRTTQDGRDYLPVYDDQESDFAATAPVSASAGKSGTGKVLYYRNPMGLPDVSPVPKKDWMGMDYIAVREGEEEDGATVKISLDKIQRSGVRTAPVEMRRLDRTVRAPAVAKPDERTLYTVTLRADGFVERLHVNETGRQVRAGEPLFRVYSPQMVAAQVDYRVSNAAPGSREERGALQRLRNIGLPEAVLDELRRTREPVISFDWPSPVAGVVMQKKIVEGQMAKAGEEMFRLADLSSIWVVADVPEQDIGRIEIGAEARIVFRAFPGETFHGRVTFVLHELEMATRTAKVRIEMSNADHRIKHEMFADVEISGEGRAAERLAVPLSALIDSGSRQVVLVNRGDGRFEPRAVRPGVRSEGFVEIREGVREGEQVVVSANFLIDAESNLKAALSAFTADAGATGVTGGGP